MKKFFSSKNLLILPIFVLIIPAIAMLFSNDVQWSLFDFFVLAVLLYGALGIFILVSSKLRTDAQKIALAVAVVLAVIYAWAELAVGIFTNLGS